MLVKLYRRENYLKKIRGFYHETELIKVITGIRRCGKSCLMQTIAEELREEGIPAANTDNRINYGPVLENIVYIYAKAKGYAVSVGRIGKLECDFIMRNESMQYSYVQVAMTILSSRNTKEREYRPLEAIMDNYPKFVVTRNDMIQQRNGIIHVNIGKFMKDGELF